MGHSPSIEKMRAERTEFQNYLDEVDKSLVQKIQEYRTEMDGEIDHFNTTNKYTDSKIVTRGKKKDFIHEKEWSLDNIKKMVDSIAGAIFEKEHKDIDGVDMPKEQEPAVTNLANLQLLIASKAFDVISGVIEQFGTKTSIKQNTKSSNKPIAPGIQLFVTVDASQKEAKGFFEKEKIFQFVFVFEARFSVLQAQSEERLNDTQMYANLLAIKREKIKQLAVQYRNDEIDDDEFDDRTNRLDNDIKKIEAKLKALNDHDKNVQDTQMFADRLAAKRDRTAKLAAMYKKGDIGDDDFNHLTDKLDGDIKKIEAKMNAINPNESGARMLAIF